MQVWQVYFFPAVPGLTVLTKQKSKPVFLFSSTSMHRQVYFSFFFSPIYSCRPLASKPFSVLLNVYRDFRFTFVRIKAQECFRLLHDYSILFCTIPSIHLATLLNTISALLSMDSMVAKPMCGVHTAFLAWSSG